jgi:tyrosyl-tRNA synthetase
MKINLIKLLKQADAFVSSSEGRRCVMMGAVRINNAPVTELVDEIDVEVGDVIQIGRTKKITITKEILGG